MIYLAFDPSLTAFGWAMLEDNEIISGCILTKKDHRKKHVYQADQDAERLQVILRELPMFPTVNMKSVTMCRDQVTIFTEQPAGSQSARAAKALGLVWGMVVTFADMYEFPLVTMTKGEIGETLCHNRHASKHDCAEAAVLELRDRGYDVEDYHDTSKVKTEARGDALAVLAAGLKRSGGSQ